MIFELSNINARSEFVKQNVIKTLRITRLKVYSLTHKNIFFFFQSFVRNKLYTIYTRLLYLSRSPAFTYVSMQTLI